MKLSLRVRYLWFYLKKRKFKTLYNFAWVYIFWWTKPIRKFLLNKLFPLLRIDPYPPFIEIEPTTACHLKCIMCEHTYWSEPPKNMSFEEFKSIIDQFPKLKWAGLTGIGSSFLNKDFLKMVKYLKERSVIVEVIDTFNEPVNEKILKELIEIQPDILFVSIYGGSNESYNKVCVGGNFNRVIENIKAFVNLKKQMKTMLPVLNFHYIVSKQNMHETTKFLEFVASLKTEVGEVLLTPLLHTFEEVKDLSIDLTATLVKNTEDKAKELGITLAYNLSVPQNGKKPPITDCVEWIMPFVFTTGHVIPCCAGNEANRRDFQKGTSLGNVFEKSFREIWYSNEYKRIREMVRKGAIPLQCRNCPIYACNTEK